MYITGGVGSTSIGEAFTVDYDLPNRTAYTETCAAIALAMFANRRVHSDAGRVAVMRGPVVYCIEGVDNGEDLNSVLLDTNACFEVQDGEFVLPILKTKAYRPKKTESLYYEANEDYEDIQLTLIPYYAFANRGETEMQVWLLRKQ